MVLRTTANHETHDYAVHSLQAGNKTPDHQFLPSADPRLYPRAGSFYSLVLAVLPVAYNALNPLLANSAVTPAQPLARGPRFESLDPSIPMT
jgi:hypothetical protein